MRVADFDSESGNFTISPYVSDGKLTHIQILTRTGTITINSSDLKDLNDTLSELIDTYLKKEPSPK